MLSAFFALSLADSISYEVKDCNGRLCYEFSLDENKATHFAKVFHKVIEDFAKTYKKDDNDDLNPTKWYWNECKYGGGAQISYTKSLLSIYMNLNLLECSGPAHIHNPRLSEVQDVISRYCSHDK